MKIQQMYTSFPLERVEEEAAMHQLMIRSRRGNVVFAVLGAMYVLAALMLFGVLMYSTHAQQSLTEMLIEVILVACAVSGFWVATNSARNLRHH